MNSTRKTISVCMITKNEEPVLEHSLKAAVSFADELIVMDTGSTDRTKEIAQGYTNQVYDFVWCDDFSAARNASFDRASCDYVMWLDADDQISEENCRKICELKESLKEDLILADYERPEHGGVYLFTRMVRREAGFVWEGMIHERLVPQDKTRTLTEQDCRIADFQIRHCKLTEPDYKRNIRIMDKLSKEELKSSFWLCGQCFLDCTLAGEEEKAQYYLQLARESSTPFSYRLEDYALINQILKFHKKMDAMLKWNVMYLECRNDIR